MALSQRHIPVSVYESRAATAASLASGVLLTPNGLHVLDQLGILSRIQERCYIPTHRIFKNDNDETTEKAPIGGKVQYGYVNHRVWRQILVDEMRSMLQDRSVEIHFDSKFDGIIADEQDGVTFRINDSSCKASMIIGSDGIYSGVRKHLAPEIQPWYTGVMGVAGHARFDSIEWPYEGYERNCTIQSKAGAIFYIAEDAKGEDVMFATQIHYPEQSRKDLANLQADPDRMLSFFTDKYDQWGATARKIIDALRRHKDSLFIWPFMKMPPLPRWFSESGRIVLIGDGAHALPPSSAQGVNQALEDAHSLGILLDSLRHPHTTNGTSKGQDPHVENRLLNALGRWQKWRQEKVDDIYEWTTNTTNVGRLPEEERKRLIAEGKVKDTHGIDMSWLFRPNIEENVQKFVQ